VISSGRSTNANLQKLFYCDCLKVTNSLEAWREYSYFGESLSSLSPSTLEFSGGVRTVALTNYTQYRFSGRNDMR
jgi:hypothetical protein